MTVTIKIPMPRIESVEADGGLRVRVKWKQSLRPYVAEVVDLAPLIESLKHFKPLRSDEDLFNTVHLTYGGSAIAWGNNDKIEMAATSVERLAEEAFTPDEFRAFLKANGLTHTQAALEFGYSRRQIENFVSVGPIPRVVVLACYGYAARKLQLQSRMKVAVGSCITIDGRYSLTETDPPPITQHVPNSELATT
jgi:hypothetical protein